MEHLLLGLLLWISQNTSFQYYSEMGLPAVEQVSQLELAKLYIGKEDSRQGFLSESDKNLIYKNLAMSLEAVYAADKNIIYVGNKVDIKSRYGHAVLVHELIHFLQKKTKAHNHVACMNALEKDAYLIQEKYMKENQMSPTFDRFTIMMRSFCEDEM